MSKKGPTNPPTTATDLDGEEGGVYAVLQRAEDEFEAAKVPKKAEEVQRIRKRCMGIVFMAEAKSFYLQKNFEECLERATEAKFCFRDVSARTKKRTNERTNERSIDRNTN